MELSPQAKYHLLQQATVGAECYSGYKAAQYPFVRMVFGGLCLETFTLLNSSDFNSACVCTDLHLVPTLKIYGVVPPLLRTP